MERRKGKLSQAEWDRRALETLRGFAPSLRECKWCRGPNAEGYICACGWDNTYHPDQYEKTENGRYEKIKE